MEGCVIWLTGLSGAGKSTIARALHETLLSAEKYKVEILDGDEVRTNLSKGLGFSKEDRDTNIKRIGYVANLLARNGVYVIVAAISPYRETREELRGLIKNFVEVYCDTPLTVCQERDPKGLYKKVASGEIKNFTGVDDPYEPPIEPHVHLHPDEESVNESLSKILDHLIHRRLYRVRSNYNI